MKAFVTNLVVAVPLCCAVSPALAQVPVAIGTSGPEALPESSVSPKYALTSPWGSPRVSPWSAQLPCVELWRGYDSQPIDRHVCGPQGHVHIRHAQPVKSLVGLVRGWIDNLLSGHQPAQSCPANSPCSLGISESVLAEPARLPRPTDPVIDLWPEKPQPEEEPGPLPIISLPSPPVVGSTPPLPLEVPDEPKLIHGPVVEIAPDLVLPSEAPSAPPRNVIPPPGSLPPRNRIPTR
jgi:hypothetical protein